MKSVDILQANRDYISAVNPGFLEVLPSEEENPWEVVIEEDKIVNLKNKIDGSLLYPSRRESHDQSQLNQWMQRPSRLVINSYQGLNTDNTSEAGELESYTGCRDLTSLTLDTIHDLNIDIEPMMTMQRLGETVRKLEVAIAPNGLKSDGCALVILGLGLGGQIQPLIDFLQPSALFIVEPDLGILAHSLYTVDYSSLISTFTGPDNALDFVVSESPEAAVEQIRSLITRRNLFLLDGLFTYTNVSKPYFQLMRQELNSIRTINSINYLGYFVDEVHMTMNAALNYFHNKPAVFNSLRVRSNDRQAVVVASGPSLADDLELLKQHREKFTIFCCYSTIGRLLEAGITPDYHCDLERHNDHLPMIERGFTNQLKNIDLCCSATCDPRLLQLYRNVYSINRGALTPSVIFTGGNDIIPNEGPDVATFAILCAIFFGYRRVHLFGVDLGTADRSLCRLPGVLDIDRRTYDVPVRGNRGKTIFSGQLLLDNKRAIEANIAYYSQVFPDLEIYNYSNGVLIEGAEPSSKDAFLSRIADQQPEAPVPPDFLPYSDEHVRQAWALADLRGRCFSFLNNLRTLADNPFSISTLYRISDLCNSADKNQLDQIPIRFYRGSLFRSWIQCWGVYQRAILTPEQEELRNDLLTSCKTIINEVIDSFENLTFQMVDFVEELKCLDELTFTSKMHRDEVDSLPIQLSGEAT